MPMTFGAIARLECLCAITIMLSSCSGGSNSLQAKPEAKAKLLASTHRGMSRVEFYDAARKADVEPVNPDYVKFGSNNGPPVNNGKFPMPDRSHPHPPVSIFIHYAADGCAIPTDEVRVTFDDQDRVAKWSTRRYITGGCP